jgi:hypothetical protein
MHPNGPAHKSATPPPPPSRMVESAKESASRHIGRHGLAYLVGLVLIGVGSLAFLPSESHAPVIGLIAGAATALIGMLQGITGTADKVEKPEVQIIGDLVNRLDKEPEPMAVIVEGERVTVTKGGDSITTKRKQG